MKDPVFWVVVIVLASVIAVIFDSNRDELTSVTEENLPGHFHAFVPADGSGAPSPSSIPGGAIKVGRMAANGKVLDLSECQGIAECEEYWQIASESVARSEAMLQAEKQACVVRQSSNPDDPCVSLYLAQLTADSSNHVALYEDWDFHSDGSLWSRSAGSMIRDVPGSGSGSTVLCEDGTVSNAGGRQGACSHHGGVSD